MAFKNGGAGHGRPVATPGRRLPRGVRILCVLLGVSSVAAVPIGVATASTITPATEPEPWPEVCSEEEIEHEGEADSDLRHLREQVRQMCIVGDGRHLELVGAIAAIEAKIDDQAQWRAAVRSELEAIKTAIGEQGAAVETTAVSTKYLADVFRGEADPGPAALPVDPGEVSIDNGTIEVSNPADVDAVVAATEQAEETMHSNMWGLAGLATGFGFLGFLVKVMRP